MYIISTSGITAVNTDRVDCFYLKQKADNAIAVIARLGSTEAEIGIYKDMKTASDSLGKAIQTALRETKGIEGIFFMPKEDEQKAMAPER